MFLSFCVTCFYHRLVLGVVCVVLVRHIGFRRLVGGALSYAWVIQTTKEIRSDKDIKSNHGCQYVV